MAKIKSQYLGDGPETTVGNAKHMVILDYGKLSNAPAGHLLVLGSVTPEFAVEINDQLHQRLYKYFRRFKEPQELFSKAISSIKLPRTHEIVRIQAELDTISELRLKGSSVAQPLENMKAAVKEAFEEGFPLEFIYDNSPENLENEYGWRSPSRQVAVRNLDEDGFTAHHERGFRRYRWEKLERAVVLRANVDRLLPELCIEISIPYEPSNPSQRVDFMVTTIHRLESDYSLGSVQDVIFRPPLSASLTKTWG